MVSSFGLIHLIILRLPLQPERKKRIANVAIRRSFGNVKELIVQLLCDKVSTDLSCFDFGFTKGFAFSRDDGNGSNGVSL